MMINKWKKLSDLKCVKKYGLGHKLGHFLGVNSLSKCYAVFLDKR